jgi:RNA polymerase sigma factor (sigma-70 family)
VNASTSQQLLRDYAERRSEAAFAELVRRHIDLVHSAALRMVREAHLAEDVTQGVFVALARDAGKLTDCPVLSGWLHRTARNLAAKVVRSDVRRRAREQEAAVMNELLASEPDAAWEQIAPHLDDALGELNEADRDALLLRYFERKSAREMAEVLGISDVAAQKRVSRAVERLRELFAKRGVSVGAGGLALAISVNAVQAAPLGMAVATCATATLAGSTVAIATATKTLAMITLPKAVAVAAVAVLAAAGIYESLHATGLRDRVRSLQQQQAPLAGQIQQLQRERDELASRLAAMADEIEKGKGSSPELLSLRAEVSRLRGDSQELARLKATGTNDPAEIELKSWLARVKQLRQEAENNPRAQIPEFSLLTEQDWLNAAKWYGRRPQFDAETDLRVAMAELRQSAQNTFASLAQQALNRFTKDHGGRFPADLAEFKPSLPIAVDGRAVDDTILDRYTIEPAEKLHMKVAGQDWVITQKELVDEDYDHRIAIGPVNWSNQKSLAEELPPDFLPLKRALDPVVKKFSDANNGQEPSDPSQLLPYVNTAEQRAAIQKAIELRNSREKQTHQ